MPLSWELVSLSDISGPRVLVLSLVCHSLGRYVRLQNGRSNATSLFVDTSSLVLQHSLEFPPIELPLLFAPEVAHNRDAKKCQPNESPVDSLRAEV